jgi:hypothetical protein
MYQKNEVFSGPELPPPVHNTRETKTERYEGIMNDDALHFSKDAYAEYMHDRPVLNVIVVGATFPGV